MKNQIIKLLKSVVPENLKGIIRGYLLIRRRNKGLSLFKLLQFGKVVPSNKSINYLDDYVRQFSIMARRIQVEKGANYVYPYDNKILRLFSRQLICSITVDFGKVLQSDLNEIRKQLENVSDISFRERELKVVTVVESLALCLQNELNRQNTERSSVLADYLSKMLYHNPDSFDEALQKILFYDALFWQMGHLHVGLGRLDLILKDYYENDIKRGLLTETQAKQYLNSFLLTLGKDMLSKSAGLLGDTGQYILLGGINSQGKNIDNKLTGYFLDLLSELRIPDPKLILRVNNNTDSEIWKKAIHCIMTGIGSPLLMNENVIMNKMTQFGYDPADVWNVGTSACWEPLVIGKSFDQNNPFRSAVAINPLNKVLLSGEDYDTFESLIRAYKWEYKKELGGVVVDIDFDCSPLFSLFFDDCIKRGKDFTEGGAIYAHHGVQVVGLPNTINALLNIKKLVYDQKLYTLSDCKRAIESNFSDMEDFRILLTSSDKKFGSTDQDVVNLTNELVAYTGEICSSLRSNGKRIKVGFSSPNYIGESKEYPASLDGRKQGDPFAVHISPISSNIDIVEILEFSTNIDYPNNCINGNVVDFILPSSYIKQPEKLVGILKNACLNGTFEIQLNVMDKATLIDAKMHPEKYPNLIVRVWGFSAYFNDLPEEYKDNLIRRAEIYEFDKSD